MARPDRLTLALAAALFVASGASGLVFEVIWVRQLTLAIGHTTFSVSLVVAAFLFGLVLGSYWLGRIADRVRVPLLAYAALELATGIFALGVTAALPALPAAVAKLGIAGAPLAVRVAIAFVVLLPPTFFMGGTLPVLTRHVARQAATWGRSFATLYALNTLGAAAGCWLAGFVLIGRVGLLRTGLIAASMNVAIALAATLVWLATRSRPGAAPEAPPDVPAAQPLSESRRRWLLAAFFAAGFASIAYEVLWFRVLTHFIDSNVYAFALLLVVFLLGLVLGGLLFAFRLSRRPRPLALLANVEALVALAALLSVALLGQGFLIRYLLAKAGVTSLDTASAFLAALVLLLPTTLIGVAFPLVAEIATQSLARAARSVGLLYSVNTLGGILGSLCAGFLLIPALGTLRAFEVVSLVTIAVSVAAAHLEPESPKRARAGAWIIAALVVVAIALVPGDYLVRGVTNLSGSHLVDLREGRDGTVMVYEFSRADICSSPLYECRAGWCDADFRYRKILYGSVSYAGSIPSGQRYMRALAHIPMLLHPSPRNVLEVCFGTGTTAASFARYPELESLTVVDINPDVLTLARHFADVNHDVTADPRARVAIDDGRHFLATPGQGFDVISFEPPPPTAVGAVDLYSREFYEAVRARLAPGGIVTQWIPLDQQSDALDKALIRSMQDVFPDVSLWIPSKLEAVLVASDRPLDIDAARIAARLAHPEVRQSLEEVGFRDAEDLLGTFLMGDAALRAYTRGARSVTDDLPIIEYYRDQDPEGFSPADLLAAAESPTSLVRGAGLDASKLARAAEANQRLIRAHVFGTYKDRDAARREVAAAEAAAGSTVYTRYLDGLEYGCLMFEPNRAPP